MIVRLAVVMMAADGRITASEVPAAEALDQLGLANLSHLVPEEINRAADHGIDLAGACEVLAPLGPPAGAVILSVLAHIAASDGVISPRERDVLAQIAGRLGLSTAAADEALASQVGHAANAEQAPPPQRGERREPELSAMPTPQPRSPAPYPDENIVTAHAILGVRPGASRSELEAAYRAAVERYNPNKVLDLGAEFAALAVHKLAQATAAFEVAVAGIAQPGVAACGEAVESAER